MNPVLKRWLIPATLLIGVLAIYRQVLGHDFTFFDDNAYVYRNPAVLDGFNWASIKWAFSTGQGANYNPVTWFSHMLDVEIFGLWAGGHAFTNLLWHAVNVLLVWRLARALSGRDGVGFFVAALFAVHPLNVESVAAISQRKTVVSACFGLISILAYLRYVERGRAWRYGLSVAAATLSMLAKPLFVTLPALFLLLDYWPLARYPGQSSANQAPANSGDSPLRSHVARLFPLIREKLPFIFLSVAISIATLFVQHAEGAMKTAKLDFLTSLATALSSYFFYLEKLVWPSNLAFFYPLPESISIPRLAICVSALVAISIIAWSVRKSHTYVLFGWLWFAGSLVPMAGFVRVGGMAMADRYAYIPLIGIYLAIAMTAAEWGWSSVKPRRYVRPLLVGCGAGSLLALAVAAHGQVGYWRTTARLFARDMITQGPNPTLLNLMGYEAFDQGDFARAIPCFEKALSIMPDHADATTNLVIALCAVGRYGEAATWLDRAAQFGNPSSLGLLNARGKIAEHQGRDADACAFWRKAIAANPTFSAARINLAQALARSAATDEALATIDTGIRLAPHDERLRTIRAEILDIMGRGKDAQIERERAIQERQANELVPALR